MEGLILLNVACPPQPPPSPPPSARASAARLACAVSAARTYGVDKLRLEVAQVEGVNRMRAALYAEGGVVNADACGFGKTCQAIVTALSLTESTGGRVLIAVLASTLQQWANELRTWAPSRLLRIANFDGYGAGEEGLRLPAST